MKKKLLALLCVAALCFAGCAPSNVEFDETTLNQQSAAYTQNMLDGDFETVAKAVSPSVSMQLSADALKNGWVETTASLGKFERIANTEFSADGASAVVDITCDFTNKALLVRYTYNAKNEIAGLWLTYTPKVVIAESTDAYTEADVSIGTEKPLHGILTIPRDVKNPPVVLMIHGSGAQDMNETIGTEGSRPFADIAHGLAEHGVASLRYNKRTAQYPGEPADPKNLTIEYEVLDDAAAAAALLKNTEGVDKQRIYVLGHSLGGMLAPKIAQESDLAGLVSLAGSPRALLDIMLDQNEAAYQAGFATSDQLNQAKALIEQAQNAKEDDFSAMLGGTGNYWYTLNQIDTPTIAQSLSVPMLFLQGDADFQVSPEKDFGAWKTILSGKPNVEFKSYPNLTHLFTPAPANPTNTIADYDALQTVDPQVVSDIAAWIAAH